MTHRIEYTSIDELKPATRNVKKHDIDTLEYSFDRFGYASPILVDERTGRIVAGHGRLEALKAKRDAGAPMPKGLEGDWRVPVVRGWSSENDAEASAYLVADNQLTIKGGWEDKELFALLDSLDDLDGTGFTLDDLDQMGKELAGLSDEEKAKKAVNAEWTVVVNCEDAAEQMMLLETLKDQGYDAKLGKKPEQK